jgi:hypothetical protein
LIENGLNFAAHGPVATTKMQTNKKPASILMQALPNRGYRKEEFGLSGRWATLIQVINQISYILYIQGAGAIDIGNVKSNRGRTIFI